jgi:hypothetical protein
LLMRFVFRIAPSVLEFLAIVSGKAGPGRARAPEQCREDLERCARFGRSPPRAVFGAGFTSRLEVGAIRVRRNDLPEEFVGKSRLIPERFADPSVSLLATSS